VTDVTQRSRWLVLLPASKGVTADARDPRWGTVANDPQREVLAALSDRDDHRDPSPVSERGTTPAWKRYDGVLHRAADPRSLEGADRRRWHRHVLYVSALAGLVGATDRLPIYRLEMARVTDQLGGLGGFWRPHVAAVLGDRLTPTGLVWCLTGGEYARAVAVPGHQRIVEPRFVQGDRSMPSATVKQARGQLARALVQHPDAARDPGADAWGDVVLTAAGKPVTFDGLDDDGVPVWRTPV
jgi:hypothetical protein